MSSIVHTGSTARAVPELSRALMQIDPTALGYAARQVLPVIKSQVKTGRFDIIKREDMLLRKSTLRAAGAAYDRPTLRTAAQEFTCDGYGQEAQIPDETRAIYATSFDAELVKSKQAQGRIFIDQEAIVSAMIFNATTWTGSTLYTDNSGSPWGTITTDIISQVEAAIEASRLLTGMRPNALICTTRSIAYMLANTGIKARFPGSAIITRQMILANLGAIFGLEKLIECGSIYNSAAEGATASLSSTWSNLYAMVARVATTDDPSEPCVGRTIQWSGMSGDFVDVGMYRENQTKSDVVQVDSYADFLVYEAAFAHLMKVCTA
jgi:hypothetical protein